MPHPVALSRGLRLPALLAIFLLAIAPAASCLAADSPTAVGDKPFAEHHLVLQLSDASAEKQGLVISVANNLLKVYDPDRIAIEVVAFGPGIDLLLADSANRPYVDSLVAQGVRFDICGNTLDTIERKTGTRPKVNPVAVTVQAGASRILELVEHGYTLIRP
jgi:intracellular sulfur oxidation DsrE/DsrF family protein